MGRTNPTFRDFLDGYEREFGDYRRALRRRAQADFDSLFAGARAFADAAGYANHLDRDTLVLVSMLLAHEGTIREQAAEIDDLRAEVEALKADVEACRTAVEARREADDRRATDQRADDRD